MAERKNAKSAEETPAEQKQDGGAKAAAPASKAEEAQATAPEGAAGPGTGKASDVDSKERMPSSTLVPSEAGPLVPTDVQKVHEPELGHRDSSTNPVSANAGHRSVTGSNHVRLVDDEDNDISADDLFEDKAADDPSIFVKVKRRVYQEFLYPRATTSTRHLLWPEGAQVTMTEAARVKASLEKDPANR